MKTNRKHSKRHQNMSELPELEFPNTVTHLPTDAPPISASRYHETHRQAYLNLHLRPPVGILQRLLNWISGMMLLFYFLTLYIL